MKRRTPIFTIVCAVILTLSFFLMSCTTSEDGEDGTSIIWLGSLATPPENPELNWAYYNTTDGIAYIWDGDSWEILVQDGQNAVSLNVQGVIAPNDYLSLQHNLGRDDLTFTAQFVKYGYVYDCEEYGNIFGYEGELIIAPTVFESVTTYYISATALSNGNFAIAYRDRGTLGYGTFVICGKPHLALEKVNNNEVRLWNYTLETLEMMLSVNQ